MISAQTSYPAGPSPRTKPQTPSECQHCFIWKVNPLAPERRLKGDRAGVTDRAAESQGKALVVAEAPRAFWTAWAKGCTRVGRGRRCQGPALTQGKDSTSYPGKGCMSWGLAGLLSMMGYLLGPCIMMELVTQYQSQTPSSPQGNHGCCSPPQKKLQGTPGSWQLWPAAGDTHLTDPSLHRESRLSLAPGAIERTCLQAG